MVEVEEEVMRGVLLLEDEGEVVVEVVVVMEAAVAVEGKEILAKLEGRICLHMAGMNPMMKQMDNRLLSIPFDLPTGFALQCELDFFIFFFSGGYPSARPGNQCLCLAERRGYPYVWQQLWCFG